MFQPIATLDQQSYSSGSSDSDFPDEEEDIKLEQPLATSSLQRDAIFVTSENPTNTRKSSVSSSSFSSSSSSSSSIAEVLEVPIKDLKPEPSSNLKRTVAFEDNMDANFNNRASAYQSSLKPTPNPVIRSSLNFEERRSRSPSPARYGGNNNNTYGTAFSLGAQPNSNLMSSLDVAEWQRKLTQAEVSHQRDKNELEHEKNQSDQLRNDLKILNSKLDDCQRRLEEEQDKKNALNIQYNRIQKQLDQKVSQNERLMIELNSAKESHILDKDFAAECKRLRDKLEQTELERSKEINELSMRNKNFENTIDTLNKKIRSNKKEADDLKNQLDDLGSGKIEAQQLLRRNTELENRIEDLETELNRVEDMLAKTAGKSSHQIVLLEKSIAEFKNKLSAVVGFEIFWVCVFKSLVLGLGADPVSTLRFPIRTQTRRTARRT